jgi:hypothetical protein
MRRRVFALLAFAACDRGHRAAPAPAPAPAPPPVPAAPATTGCKLPALPLHRTAPGRVVAIGDLHGDFEAARAAFRAAGATDATDHWIGGNLTIVQTGDVVDRGDGEREILELVTRLEGEARGAGGQVIALVGNHELMNAAGDYRYVTPGADRDFDGHRAAELAPGGDYAKRIAATHDVVAIVNDTVYSHAGVLPAWASRLDEVNATARCWLDGQAGGASEPPIALTADDSPVWTRAYGMPAVDCAQVSAALAALGAKRMVVGHTVQDRGINSACDGALWRIDVGMTKVFGGPIQVLDVSAGKPISGSR